MGNPNVRLGCFLFFCFLLLSARMMGIIINENPTLESKRVMDLLRIVGPQ